MEAIGEDGALDLREQRNPDDVKQGYVYLAEGDVIVAKVTPCFENGKAAVARGLIGGHAFATTEVYTLRPRMGVDAEYIYYALREARLRQWWAGNMTGAHGVKRVSLEVVRATQMFLPPLPEQRAIAAYLDHETAEIDALVAAQEGLIATLRERRTAVVDLAIEGSGPHHALKHYLRDNSSGVWGNDPVGDGEDTFVLRSTEQTESGEWRIEDPALRRLTERDRHRARLLPGDLVVTTASGSQKHIGKTTLVTSDVAELGACYSNFMQRLRCRDEMAPTYLWRFLMSNSARQQLRAASTTATGLANLNAGSFANLRIPLPPLDEQRRIADYLDEKTAEIDALIAETERFIAVSKERRSALITAAVTGQIDCTHLISEGS